MVMMSKSHLKLESVTVYRRTLDATDTFQSYSKSDSIMNKVNTWHEAWSKITVHKKQ